MSRYPTRNSNTSILSHLSETFDQLLSTFDEGSHFQLSNFSTREWTPKIDIKEEDNQYIIFADIPGVKSSEIDISVNNGVLKIKGQQSSSHKEKTDNFLRVERSSGSFMRELMLPSSIDTDNIKAKAENGVLRITLPKADSQTGRKIPIDE